MMVSDANYVPIPQHEMVKYSDECPAALPQIFQKVGILFLAIMNSEMARCEVLRRWENNIVHENLRVFILHISRVEAAEVSCVVPRSPLAFEVCYPKRVYLNRLIWREGLPIDNL